MSHSGRRPARAPRLGLAVCLPFCLTNKCRFALLLALLGCLLPRLVAGEPPPVQLAIIVAPESALSNLSSADLKRVYTAETVTSEDGKRLVPFNHPPKTPDRVGFDQVVLGRDPDGVGRYWIDQRIRGGSGPPRSVDNVMMLRRVVAKLPGAIAYLRPSFLTDEVRAIRVDGKLPGEPGYPIEFRP